MSKNNNWTMKKAKLEGIENHFVLKTVSDKIIYGLGRYSFFLGFIMSKYLKVL